MALRVKNAAVTLKIEGTEGTDAVPTASDVILVENPRVNFKPNLVKTNEVTGSLDGFGQLVGGMTAEVSFDVYLKGAGAAGTAPEYGAALKACGMAETITSAAIPVAAEVGTAGTATTLTLGAGATGTAQLYRYMPLALTVNPTSATTFVTDYTASKVATLTDTFSPVLDNTTKYQVLPNVLYTPASTSIPSVSIYVYLDGVLYKFVGGRGSWQLSLDSGGPGKLTFSFWAMFSAKVDASIPAVSPNSTRPPIWKNGVFSINRQVAAVKSLSFQSGNQLVHDDNPNAAEGYDPAVIVSRDITGNMDPTETLVATRDLMTAFRNGTKQPVHARLGSTAGNRVGITVAQALYTNHTPQDRNGIATVGVPFDCVGQDSGIGICLY